MRFKAILFLTTAFFIVFSLATAGPVKDQDMTPESLKKSLKHAESVDELTKIVKKYAMHSSDIDAVRMAQDEWKSINYDEALDFFKKHYEKDASGKNAYLLGRISSDPVLQVELGKIVIKEEPDWQYGYRLLTVVYSHNLVDRKSSPEVIEILEQSIKKDGKYFEKTAKKFSDADDLMHVVFNYFLYAGDYKSAQKLLEKSEQQKSKWADERAWAIVNVGLGNKDEVKKYIQQTVSEKQKKVKDVPLEKLTQKIKYDIYRSAFVYEPILEHYLKKSEDASSEMIATNQYNVACFAALSGKTEMAMEYLDKSASSGFYDADLAMEDSDLFSMHKEPQWKNIVKHFEDNWTKSEDKRMQKALSSKFEKEAPGWSLKDGDGNMVQLASIEGNIVVLDFWATWCKPCIESLPGVSEFTREYAAKGVKVYSVNVMEKNPVFARDFMKKNEYAMTFLYGTEKIQKAYKVENIPTIVMIDQGGKIRYVHHGYAKDLKQKLSWWANDLLETKAAQHTMVD
ncbi:MAG: TlpA disulfide reductase family protein [Candidatus Electryonea clarkiae]|nr:TlpA disulfide reductase family protein [Candidatus Electryonea clarkiae]